MKMPNEHDGKEYLKKKEAELTDFGKYLLQSVYKENGKVELQAIGAGALNQAIKGIAIARGFVAPSGIDLVCIPAFADVEVEGEDRTGIKLIVKGE